MLISGGYQVARWAALNRMDFCSRALGRTGGPAEAGCRPDPALWAIGPRRPEAEGRDRKEGRPERSEGNAQVLVLKWRKIL